MIKIFLVFDLNLVEVCNFSYSFCYH